MAVRLLSPRTRGAIDQSGKDVLCQDEGGGRGY